MIKLQAIHPECQQQMDSHNWVFVKSSDRRIHSGQIYKCIDCNHQVYYGTSHSTNGNTRASFYYQTDQKTIRFE